ncbi:unnamed protein product [Urochloa humidicola]
MWRRRWARAAAALCLAVVVVLQLLAAGEGGRPPPPERAGGHAHAHRARGLPPSLPVHHDDASAGATVGFNAAAAGGVRCKSSGREAGGAVGRGGAACAEDNDDKRRIPTGANPLHNR